jgi:hypothetical protein
MNLKLPFLILVLSIAAVWQSCKSDVDTDMPYILLKGDNPYYINTIGGTFTEPGYTSVDDIDGDLTSQVKVTYPIILPDSAKSYEAVYTVSDRSGNAFTTRRYIVVRNSDWFISGFFSYCSQVRSDSIIDTLFSASVIPSLVNNGEFSISNFGNLGYGADVIATVNEQTQKIAIPTPQLLADSSTLDAVDPDSSYYVLVNDTIRFQIFYTHSKNGNSENCRSYYQK